MLNVEYTPQQMIERLELNKELLSDAQRIYIRRSFDKAILPVEAESWIQIAKEQGYHDMATEMESDLQHELETA